MRKLGVAAAAAALVGTIAAVMPAGIAHADISAPTLLPNPIAGKCTAAPSTGCWRYTSYNDGGSTPAPLPVIVGDKLQLNAVGTQTLTDFFANAAWYNTPIGISGQAIEATYTAYLDGGDPTKHNEGLTFALVEGNTELGGANIPAPVPFDPTPRDGTHPLGTDYGAGDGGLGFSGYKGETGNDDGHKNLAVALLTASAERDALPGTDVGYNASRVGLLKGRKWPVPMTADPDPHKRTDRWYDVKNVSPSIYGGATANSRPVHVGVQIYPTGVAGTWHATVYIDGAKTLDSDVQLPPVVYMGFTSSTGEFPQRHAISDVSIKYGTPVAPSVTASPNPVDLGSVHLGSTSAPAPVTLTNNGTVDATVSQGSVPAGFAVTGLPATLAPGQSVALGTTFTPSALGAAGGNVTLNVASIAGNGTSGFAVSGTGVPVGTSIGAPYTQLPPTRILNTRPNNPIGPGLIRSAKVTGVGGVPEGAGAVIMNVTVTEPTTPGYITVFPTGTPRPKASNLNFVAGQNIANLVTAKVGTGGQVDIYNFAGNTHVLFDVVGWFPDTSGASATTLSTNAAQGGEFVPLTPVRILDTREGKGAPQAPLGPNGSLHLQVAGSPQGGVPATGASAVVMNLTATNTTATSYLTAWPTGLAKQETSNVNFTAGTNTPNLAVVPLGTNGQIDIYNYAGNTDVIADVVGYYTAPGVSVLGGGLFHAMSPNRFVDTRPEADNLTRKDGDGLIVRISGQKGIPTTGVVGVVANVTATNTTAPGYLTVFPSDAPLPNTSSLNFVPGQSVPNLAMSKLSSGGDVAIYNYSPGGTTDVVVDVVGWYGTA